MSAVNPYTPPRAAVADVDADDGETGVQPVKFFSSQGRIGRMRYAAYMFYAYLLMSLASGVLGVVAAAVGLGEGAALALVVLIGLASLVYFFLVTIQRSHDMGWSGWTSLLTLIPLVVFVWIFKGGDRGRNDYGLPAPPNTTAVRIGAFLFPAIMVIGILAAIALPAYQSYVMRAKAAQMK